MPPHVPRGDALTLARDGACALHGVHAATGPECATRNRGQERNLKMKSAMLAMALLAQPILAAGALAQDAARAEKAPGENPAGVSVRDMGERRILVNDRGMTLYTVDVQTAIYGGGDGRRLVCRDACTQKWTPLSAPADAAPVGEWTVETQYTLGPQWAYRGNPVFTHQADKAPGEMRGNGFDQIWWTIDYVPTPPKLAAPPVVSPLFLGRDYVLADANGHALFTPAGDAGCTSSCAGWKPLLAGLASLRIGDWAVLRTGDRAQWAYRGKPVFVSAEARSVVLPEGAALLRP